MSEPRDRNRLTVAELQKATLCDPPSSPSAPTRAAEPTREQLETLRKLADAEAHSPLFQSERVALASLLRAYEGMRADAEMFEWLITHSYDGSVVIERADRPGKPIAIRLTREGIRDIQAIQSRAARASAPDRAPGDANG